MPESLQVRPRDVNKSHQSQSRSPEKSEHPDSRVFLQNSLIKKCQSNPRYSLRAFAKYLGTEPSFLSKILAGKRSVTPKFIERCGQKLGLAPNELKSFIEHSPKTTNTDRSQVLSAGYQTLTHDHFQIISDWYHFAILELTKIEGFRPEEKWIANKLNITVFEARDAIQRLVRLKLLKKKINTLVASGSFSTVGGPATSAAFRKLQIRILEQAIEALQNTAIEDRDQSAITMAIDKSKLPEAKLKIREFRRSLCQFLQPKKAQKTHVFQLAISLFPITKDPKKSLKGESK